MEEATLDSKIQPTLLAAPEGYVMRKANKNKGLAPNDKQLEALRKAHLALKEKRENLAKEKDERKAKGEPEPVKVPVPRIMVAQNYGYVKPVKIRKERTVYTTPLVQKTTVTFSDSEYSQIKELLNKDKNPVVEKEIIKEIPVEKIVHTEKVVHTEKFLTGSDLLNKIFF